MAGMSSSGPLKERIDNQSERPNIHKIARLANVSIATVSRTINNLSTVNPLIAKRVWDVVQELGYFPNTQARALVSGRSWILGLIVSDITNPFFPELIQGFEDVAVEHGYEILVSSTNYDPKRMAHCVRRMIERKVDGVAVMTFGIEAPMLEQLLDRNIPLVFIDVGPNRPRVSLLQVDYQHGMREGVEHLVELGHTKIAFVSGPRHLHSAQLRLEAFVTSLEENSIRRNPHWVLEGDHTVKGGISAIKKLLAGNTMPTAVMCSNDLTAIGVLHGIHRAGLRVPDHMSVIGFDDIGIAEITIPPLTTVQMSRYQLARGAVDSLRKQIGDPQGALSNRSHKISTNLVVRESTGTPKRVRRTSGAQLPSSSSRI